MNKLSYLLLIGIGITLSVWGCKENPVESLNLKKEHAGRGLIDLQTTAITHNTVTVKVNATSDGGEAITERGFVSSEQSNPTIQDKVTTVSGNAIGTYSGTINGLWGSTTYFVKAYVKNKNGVFYGEELEVKTSEPIIPTVKSIAIAEITAFKAKVTIEFDNGGSPILDKGIAIGTNPEPTISNSIAEKEQIQIEFTKRIVKEGLQEQDLIKKSDPKTEQNRLNETLPIVEKTNATANKEKLQPELQEETEEVILSNLVPATTYYIRAYVRTEKGLSYGNNTELRTPSILQTHEVTDIKALSAMSGATISQADGDFITARGLVWNTQANPTIQNNFSMEGSGFGSFTSELTNLQANTTYYVRSYATSSGGTSYGNELSFTTRDGVILLTTNEATEITATSAKVSSAISDDGGAAITERGVVYAESSNPTTSNFKISTSGITDNFTVNLTGLKPNTTYYVRSYAINGVGTSYGNELNFTTKDGVILLTTIEATEITATSAKVSSAISDDGGSAITERGIVYAESSNPTTLNTKVSTSGTTGEFIVSLNGLKPNTTYYVRSYGINGFGTIYGNQVSFSTLPPPITNSIGMEFVYIEPGSFYMGATVGDSDEQPVHQVTLTQGFYMGKYEVTQKQWVEIMGSNPSSTSYGIGDTYPVNHVSWNDIQTFITKLNEKEGGSKYRLPTEAEWEYCAHAGTATNGEGPKWHFGNDESQLTNYAWYSTNSGLKSHEVGTKLPNQYGLYDMHGNVWEWVQDYWYGSYSSGSQADPQGPNSGTYRVLRGGSWGGKSSGARSSGRSGSFPVIGDVGYGFRLLRTYP